MIPSEQEIMDFMEWIMLGSLGALLNSEVEQKPYFW